MANIDLTRLEEEAKRFRRNKERGHPYTTETVAAFAAAAGRAAILRAAEESLVGDIHTNTTKEIEGNILALADELFPEPTKGHEGGE